VLAPVVFTRWKCELTFMI